MKKFLSGITLFSLIVSCNAYCLAVVLDDVSRLNATQVYTIVQPGTVKEIQDAVLLAKKLGKKVAVAGQRHSQGGQISYDDALVIDMLNYNKILHLDVEHKIITVQSGVTWKQVQEYCNSYNLAVKTMQSFNAFTVGGSLSVNVHGLDFDGPLIASVVGFRMVTAQGKLIEVTRYSNAELFKLVIGGYGLFGVITDVDIELTKNVIYDRDVRLLSLSQYRDFFNESVKNHKKAELHFARFNIDQHSQTFLDEIMAVTYYKKSKNVVSYPALVPLQPETNTWLFKNLLHCMRQFSWAKKIKFFGEYWGLKKSNVLISRNNAMYNGIEFLDYKNSSDTDILQEYFIPVEYFEEFTEFLRKICREKKINLLNVTIRYVPVNLESVLTYAQKESFALVLYINHKRTKAECLHAQTWTQQLIDKALSLEGTYYLPYQLYASQEQLQKAYPGIGYFFARKKYYDPHELFVNHFYGAYGNNVESFHMRRV